MGWEKQSGSASFWQRRASIVFIGALDPDEGLEVDHVAGVEVAKIAADGSGEGEQAFIGREIWARFVVEGEAVRVSGTSGHVGFQEDVLAGLGDEGEDGEQRP